MNNSSLSGVFLVNADLTGASISYTGLFGANLIDAHLDDVHFSGVGLSGVNMKNTSLLDADFDILIQENNQIIPVYLEGANLHNSRLAGSFLAGATLAGADLSHADFSEGGKRDLKVVHIYDVGEEKITLQPSLAGTNLRGAHFRDVTLISVDLQRAQLEGADFHKADLRNSDFSRAILSNANLSGANLEGALLIESDLTGANLAGADLGYATLTDFVLDQTTFVNVDNIEFPPNLSYEGFKVELLNADCTDGIFLLEDGGSLESSPVNYLKDEGRQFYSHGEWEQAIVYICAADMTATEWGGDVGFVYLAGVNMSESDLSNTDLSQAILEDVIEVGGMRYNLAADLTDVTYDEFTIWPPGYNPPPKKKGTEY